MKPKEALPTSTQDRIVVIQPESAQRFSIPQYLGTPALQYSRGTNECNHSRSV